MVLKLDGDVLDSQPDQIRSGLYPVRRTLVEYLKLSDDDSSADEGASAELARLAVAAKHDSSDDDSPARGAAVRAAAPAPKWEESRPAHRGVSLDMD